VVVAHTNLTEVTWMVLVEVGSNYRGDLRQKDFDKYARQKNTPVVMLTTSKTATSRMLSVLSYTAVTSRYVATVLAGF